MARRNAQAAFNNAQPNRGASVVKTKVFIIEEHQEGESLLYGSPRYAGKGFDKYTSTLALGETN